MTKKQVLKIVLYLISVVLLVVLVGNYLNINRKEDAIRTYAFYEEPKDSIDVVYLGCSELMRGYIAPLAYKEQGFTSFPLATAGMTMALYPYVMQECERVQKPQLYIVEVNGVYYPDQLEESKLRQWLDNTPLNSNKYAAISNLVPAKDRFAFFIPFDKYHSNWKNVKDLNTYRKFKNTIADQGYSFSKNFNADFNFDNIEITSKYQKRPMTKEGKKYFIKYLDFLKENNYTNVLFVRWPHSNQFEVEGSYDDVIELVGQYGYKFVNFTDHMDEIGIIPKEDFADVEHLNPIGAEKMTKYIAKYVMDNYDIKTDHSAEVTKEWEYCAEKMDEILPLCKDRTLQKTKKRLYTDYAYLELIEEYKK